MCWHVQFASQKVNYSSPLYLELGAPVLLMVYFRTDTKIMFNICYGIIIGLPVRATPNQDKKKYGQSSQKALRVSLPLQWGRFLRGGNGSFQIVWRTDLIGSRFGTNTKLLRAVTGPISTRNDYLNTVFDDVVSLRGSCRNKRPSHGPHERTMKEYVHGLFTTEVELIEHQTVYAGVFC